MLILLGALATAGSMVYLNLEKVVYVLAPNAFVALALVIAGVIAFVAIGKAGLPDWAGEPQDPEVPKQPLLGPLSVEWTIYLGALVAVPLLAFLVKGGTLATILLGVMGVGALAYLIFEAARATSIERDRIIVILVLIFFSMLFWAFFEQAGSSMSLFTDRNVDRVVETQLITADQVGQTVEVQLTQGLTGHTFGDEVVTLDWVEERLKDAETVQWPVSEDDVGMKAAGDQIATSQFLAANPIFILIFGLVFSWLWTTLGKINLDPSPSVKFSLGLMQLGLGFGALWYGTQNANALGMVSMSWLLLAYLLHTTGELCLSPVGLSMVTKLSPKRIVAAVMGAWFMSSAFANYLSGAIAKLTGVGGEGGEVDVLPPPLETLDVYAAVFGPLGLIAIGAGVLLLVISPLLTKLMHLDELDDDGGSAHGH
ncbi:MAG: hypothetical protein H6740_13605 [Alphaproteobacteria bacterium]|nr:hypothetical protein [Alphaproteobacteria bacterium]